MAKLITSSKEIKCIEIELTYKNVLMLDHTDVEIYTDGTLCIIKKSKNPLGN